MFFIDKVKGYVPPVVTVEQHVQAPPAAPATDRNVGSTVDIINACNERHVGEVDQDAAAPLAPPATRCNVRKVVDKVISGGAPSADVG